MFEIFDLEKVGKGHLVQISQWTHSIANIKMCKRLFSFVIFAKIRPVRTQVTYIQTDG